MECSGVSVVEQVPPGRDALTPTALRAGRVALAAVALARLAVVLRASEPGVVPDEPGYWAVARWLSGRGPRLQMLDLPFYEPVHGLTLLPVELLPVDPTIRYRIALLLGFAALVGSAWLVRFTVRTLGGGELAATVSFTVVLLWPPTLLTTSFTWSESTVLLWLCAVVAGTAILTTTPARLSTTALLGLSLMAGTAPFVHGRLAVLVPLWAAMVLLSWHRRTTVGAPGGLGTATAVLSLLATGAATASGLALRSAARNEIYRDASSAAGRIISTATDPSAWSSVLAAALGQAWYALVASAGMVAVGAVALVRVALDRTAEPPGVRRFATALLVAVAGIWAVSACFMGATVADTGVEAPALVPLRWDHVTYGRYIDPAVLLLTVTGVCGLLVSLRGDRTVHRTRIRLRVVFPWAAVVTVLLAAGVVMRWSGAGLEPVVQTNIAALAALGLPGGATGVLVATGLAVVAMALMHSSCADQARFLRAGLIVLALWALGALAAALSFHGTYGFSGMYEDLGHPPGAHDQIIVSSDARLDAATRLNWPGQQLMLGGSGWELEFSDDPSDDLGNDPPQRAGVLALAGSARPTGDGTDWEQVAAAGEVRFWKRTG